MLAVGPALGAFVSRRVASERTGKTVSVRRSGSVLGAPAPVWLGCASVSRRSALPVLLRRVPVSVRLQDVWRVQSGSEDPAGEERPGGR